MQKAIYYCSRLIAARGVLELTDRMLNFEVSSLDASFGIKNVSVDLTDVTDIRIEAGDLNPRVVLCTVARNYEFVLSGGQELYDRLRDLVATPGEIAMRRDRALLTLTCNCGREIDAHYRFCPWCGTKL